MIANRIEAARRHRNCPSCLPIVSKANFGDLSSGKSMQALIDHLKLLIPWFRDHHGVRLGAVFIDTVSASFAMKDENDNAQAATIVSSLRRLSEAIDALVLPVHHYGKSDAGGLRGASAFRANADGLIGVNASRNDASGLVGRRSVAVGKYRDGEEGPVGAFSLEFHSLGSNEFGEEFGSCSVVPTDGVRAKASSPRLSDRQMNCLSALSQVIADRGKRLPVSFGIPGDPLAVHLRTWRDEIIARSLFGRECKNERTEFHRLMDALARRGKIGIRDDHVWVVAP